MLENLFTGWHLVIILVVVVLLFGATKLPALAKAVGQSARIFKSEVKGLKEDDAKTNNAATDASITPVANPVQEAQPKP